MMVLLLCIALGALSAQTIVFGRSIIAFILPAIIAVLTLSAIFGSYRAAIAIKYLYYVIGTTLLLSLFASRAMPGLLVGRRLVTACVLLAVALYISKSTVIETFYKKRLLIDKK